MHFPSPFHGDISTLTGTKVSVSLTASVAASTLIPPTVDEATPPPVESFAATV